MRAAAADVGVRHRVAAARVCASSAAFIPRAASSCIKKVDPSSAVVAVQFGGLARALLSVRPFKTHCNQSGNKQPAAPSCHGEFREAITYAKGNRMIKRGGVTRKVGQ